MADIQYDKVIHIDIGFNDAAVANYVGITNVVYFSEEVVSPDGDLVDPMTMINGWNPAGIHQNHKYWKLQFQLDTNWSHLANPENYWAYTQNVDAGDTTPAIVDAAANPAIGYFVVHIREPDGTLLKFTYTDEDTNSLWCVGEKTEYNNETGERRQTTTFDFICLIEKAIGVGAAVAAMPLQGPAKIKRIDLVRTNADTGANIIRFSDEFIMAMTPQFIPNTYLGVGMKQDEKFRKIIMVFDSETDIFDEMLAIVGAQVAAATQFEVEFNLTDVGTVTGLTEKWAYAFANTWMTARRPGKIDDTSGRSTFEYEFISWGARTITQA